MPKPDLMVVPDRHTKWMFVVFDLRRWKVLSPSVSHHDAIVIMHRMAQTESQYANWQVGSPRHGACIRAFWREEGMKVSHVPDVRSGNHDARLQKEPVSLIQKIWSSRLVSKLRSLSLTADRARW